MITTHRSLAVTLLLSLCGCASMPGRLPWQSADRQNSGGISEVFEQNQSEAPTNGDKSEGKIKPPALNELADAGLEPVDQPALARCAKLLALPAEEDALADPTNFGERKRFDDWGRSLKDDPQVIVLHETVINEQQTVDLFKTPHPEDHQQGSYHLLITRDGSRLRIVPDDKRAFGSGMSAFGDATQRTKTGSVGSINNIALHVSLVSPEDGRDDRAAHSGYTGSQYRNLAGQVLLWQGKYGIPMTRVTTHFAVDRSHSRYDPRSFRWDRFDVHYLEAARRCGFLQFDNQQAGL